jgi:hypothetical protein
MRAARAYEDEDHLFVNLQPPLNKTPRGESVAMREAGRSGDYSLFSAGFFAGWICNEFRNASAYALRSCGDGGHLFAFSQPPLNKTPGKRGRVPKWHSEVAKKTIAGVA